MPHRPEPATRRLLVSIHDVSPRFESAVDRLVDQLAPHVGEAGFAMLVVPDHWGDAPIGRAPAFAARLRRWADAGVEMFVHGLLHRDDSVHAGRLARWRATRMTAGEGEFLGLDAAEAGRRLTIGRDVVEQAIGRAVTGFIAPAWLYGPGARLALARTGFALAEDHLRVWNPVTGSVLARGPVVTWASRSRWRTASSLAVAAVARRSLGRMPVVRVAVHPGDTGKPALLASIDATLGRFGRSHRVGRYADLAVEAAA